MNLKTGRQTNQKPNTVSLLQKNFYDYISNRLKIVLRLNICTNWLEWKNRHFRFCFLLRSESSAWINTWNMLVSKITFRLRLSGCHLPKTFDKLRLCLHLDYLWDFKLYEGKHSELIFRIFLFLISRANQPINCIQSHLICKGSGHSLNTTHENSFVYRA